MLDYTAIAGSLDVLFSNFWAFPLMVAGLLIGLIGGAIPGINISTAMAIFLPLTFKMDFASALYFLTAIFTGAGYGGGITAILMNIPGTASAVATAFDGYPMAQQGKHNEALGYSLGASSMGCFLGYIALIVLISPIANAVLKLGPAEMVVLILWGVSLIATIGGGSMLKALACGFFGLLLGTLGTNEAGYIRGTMGITIMLDGIPPIPAMIGLFALSELFNLANQDYIVKDDKLRQVSVPKFLRGFASVLKYPVTLLRGTVLGALIGAVPGIGGSVSNLLSYSEAKRCSKHPEVFGTGTPEGIVAAESANSSGEAGSMATLLALGIPGSGATAIMLAVLAMHNITGGPSFINEHKELVYAVLFANLFQCVGLVMIGLLTLPFLSSIVKVPLTYLVPSILVIATFGSYGMVGHISGPIITMIFAVVGWFLKRNGYSVAAMVIGLVLGKSAESTLINLYQISGGELLGFIFGRPIAGTLAVLLVIMMLYPPVKQWLIKKRLAKKSA